YSRVTTGPWTTISPTAPSGTARSSDQAATASSVTCITSTRIPGTGRPTQTPAPRSVARRGSPRISSPPGGEAGGDSGAPEGGRTWTPGASMVTTSSITRADTGAPAEMTRRSVGSLTPRDEPYAPTRLSRAGEPNRFVTPNVSTASTIFDGSTSAGRVASISGTTEVIPSAGAKRAKRGNVQRSISPGSIP